MTYRVVNTDKRPILPKAECNSPEEAWFMAGLYTAYFTMQRDGAAKEVFNKLMLMNPTLDVQPSDMSEILMYAAIAKDLRAWQGEEKWNKMVQMLSSDQSTTATPACKPGT